MVGSGKHVDAFLRGIVEHAKKLVYLIVVVLVILISCTTRHHSIEFVEEEQGGGVLLRILKQLANLLLRTVHQGACNVVRHHLYKMYAHFLCHFFCEECLAASCRSVEEHRRGTNAVCFSQVMVLENVDESFSDHLFQTVHASNVTETMTMLLSVLLSCRLFLGSFSLGFLLLFFFCRCRSLLADIA